MHFTNHVYPNFERQAALAEDRSPGPIAMVNLLKFHTSAEVQAIGVHREAGLAGQLLILTRPEVLPPGR